MSKKITLNLNGENFSNLVDRLQDLSSISDVLKIKIDKENILAYSILSNDVSVLCLKSYSLKTIDYISNFNTDDLFDFVIVSASKFVKNLKFFNTDIPIKLDLSFKPSHENESVMHVRSSLFYNGKLKISWIGGELSKIKDIKKSNLDDRLNPAKSKWSFKISKGDFVDIKKLCNINSDDKILSVVVNDGKVFVMEEYKWEIEVDEIQNKSTKITFNKKYLSNINDDIDHIEFSIFETFILVRDDDSNLMLSFETDFTTEDE